MQALREMWPESNDKAARIIALPLESDTHDEEGRRCETAAPPLTDKTIVSESPPAPLTVLRRCIPFLGVVTNGLLAVLLISGWFWQQRTQIQAPSTETHPALPAAPNPKAGFSKEVSSEKPVAAEKSTVVNNLARPEKTIKPFGWSSKWMHYSTQLSFDGPIWLSKQLVATGGWRQYSWKLEPHPVLEEAIADMPIVIPRPWRLPILDPELSAAPTKVEQALPPALNTQKKIAHSADQDTGTPEPHLAQSTVPPRPNRMQKTVSLLSPADQASVAYQEALAAYRQGRSLDTEAALRLALDLDPGHVEARALAVHLMIEQGRLSKAHELLLAGIEAAPQHYPFAQSLARILASQGHIQAALTRMEQGRSSAQQDPNYLALLAWLYQRSDRHIEAAKSYIDALALNPEQGKWWLGLAISLEAGQDRLGALEAYEYALTMGLEAGLRQFAIQRRRRLALP